MFNLFYDRQRVLENHGYGQKAYVLNRVPKKAAPPPAPTPKPRKPAKPDAPRTFATDPPVVLSRLSGRRLVIEANPVSRHSTKKKERRPSKGLAFAMKA